VCRPHKRKLQVNVILVSRKVSEGLLDISVEGVANWWRLLQKAVINVIVELP
jgi:hypothetical protein